MSTPSSALPAASAPRERAGAVGGWLTRPVRRFSDHLPALAVALVVLVVSAPLGNGFTTNAHPRIALAAALVDERTIEIDPYQSLLTVDYAVKDGTTYSDKAPGASVIFAPVYAAYRFIGGASVLEDSGPVYFLAKLTLATIPAGLLAFMMTSVAARVTTRRAGQVALMLAMGTILLPFATLPFGHLLAATLGFGAFTVLTRQPLRPVVAVFGGLLAGVAVTVEYPLGAVLVGLTLLLAVTDRRSVVWYLVGAAPPLLALAAYDWAAFGGPFTSPYRYAVAYQGEYSGLGLAAPDFGTLFATLAGERGLFVLTPIVLVAIVGFAALGRAHQIPRPQVILVGAIVALFALLPAVWGDEVGATGGSAPGPRFFIPALPFLVLPLAAATVRWPWLALGAAAISFLTMALATVTDPIVDQDATAITLWLDDLFTAGDLRYNAFSDALGNLGWAIYGLLAAGAAALAGVEFQRASRGTASA